MIKIISIILAFFASSPVLAGITNIKFKNDSERLELEFNALKTENKALYETIEEIAVYIGDSYKKDIIITHIGRSQHEQDEMYAGKARKGIPYVVKPWFSPHQFNHAIDIRTSHLTEDQISDIVDYINARYNITNLYPFTALYHNVGYGYHIHINYVK